MIAQLWLSLSITKLLSCHISNPFYPQIINYHEGDWFCVCVRPSWACQWTFNQSNDSKSDKKGTNWKGCWANTSSSPSATLAEKVKKPPRLKKSFSRIWFEIWAKSFAAVPLGPSGVPWGPFPILLRFEVPCCCPSKPLRRPSKPPGKILRPKV